MGQDEEVAQRIAMGKEWLVKMFGPDKIHDDERYGKPAIIINYQKLLKNGASGDDVVQWFNRYVREHLAGSKFMALNDPQNSGSMVMLTEQFGQVGVVNALAKLSFELLEHKLTPEYAKPYKDGSDTATYISHAMPVVPVLAASTKRSAPVLSEDVALAALNDATGVKWIKRQCGNTQCYSTVTQVSNREELSTALRSVLKTHGRDLPDFMNGNNVLSIPTHYIDGGNLGMLIEAKEQLLVQFNNGRDSNERAR